MKKGKWNVTSPMAAWIMERRDLEERKEKILKGEPMQKITLIGHLGKDVEERVTAKGMKLTTFSLAVTLTKDKTVWYDCLIWPDRLEGFKGILPYLKKGSKVCVMGDLDVPSTYQGRDGETKVNMRMQPYSISFVGVKEKKEEFPGGEYTQVEVPF